MVLMLVNLQGAAAIFRVGQHHHRGPFCEGRGLTHALKDTPPTDLTVATHSPLGAQLQSDRIFRLPCGRLEPAAGSVPTCSPSMPSSVRAAAPACRRAGALEVRYRAAVGVGEEAHSRQPELVPMVETGKCGDVGTRA